MKIFVGNKKEFKKRGGFNHLYWKEVRISNLTLQLHSFPAALF